VDVTRKGIDKAYGIARLLERLRLTVDDMLFVGDRLDVSGNDYPVLAMGVPCVAVHGWEDTAEYLRTLLARDVWPEPGRLADERAGSA
jgi:hydroxymethylpyrimidine pyrophosphatase-like HAD family hydrolase